MLISTIFSLVLIALVLVLAWTETYTKAAQKISEKVHISESFSELLVCFAVSGLALTPMAIGIISYFLGGL